MAKYTVELRTIVESGVKIFDFVYPFYDEKKRSDFERKFIQHFYFREIGCETVDRFKWYLRDKMDVVFPYYNKLFEAAAIQYDLLNNYNLTEEFVTTRENTGKTSGISSTVGQVMGTQETDSKQNRVTDTTGNVTTGGTDTETEKTETDTANDSTSKTTTKDSTTGETSSTKTTDNTTTTTGNVVKKFLDTPQGLTDLSNSKFLTTLNQDTENGSQSVDGSEKVTGTSSGETNGSNDTTVSGTGNSDTDRTLNRTTNSTQDSTGKETTDDTMTGTVHDEQKSTHDNNTRTYTDSTQTEKHTLTRIGNIGVQTGADMIRIHTELQKTLAKIEKMFFDECEDLFMMVY